MNFKLKNNKNTNEILYFLSTVGIILIILKSSIQVKTNFLISNFFLLIGLVLINYASYKLSSKLFFKKYVFGFFIFIILPIEIIIFFNDQKFDTTLTIFRLICYNLSICGLIHGTQSQIKLIFNNKLKLFLNFFILILLIFYLSEIDLSNFSSRYVVLADEMSAVGISFNYGLMCSILIFLIIDEKINFFKFFYLLNFLISFYICLTTGSRGFVLGLFFIFIFSFFKKNFLISFTKFFVIFFIVYLIFTNFYEESFFLIENLINRFSNFNFQYDNSVIERQFIIQNYLNQWNKFIIFGLKNYNGPYPHNFFLDWIIRFGIFGILIIILITRILFKTISNKNKLLNNYFDYIIFGILIYSIMQSQVSLQIEYLRFFWFSVSYFYIKEKLLNKFN